METFQEPCNAYYKILVDGDDSGYKYRNLSPFEFSNITIKLAQKKMGNKEIINAGIGNPNFFATIPRYAFGLLTIFATRIGDEETKLGELGMIPSQKGIGDKLFSFLNLNQDTETGRFLLKAVKTMQMITGFSSDKLVHDIVISTIGCFYPSPSRVQPFVEPVLSAFLTKNIYGSNIANKIKIFPTEGESSILIYVFNSLKYNHLVIEGDYIGILTPIFSPYLEIPALGNYKLVQICIQANEESQWEIPDKELAKIANKEMKALFLCNPTNPTAISLSSRTTQKIGKIVKRQNPNLIVLEDNVYAPFVDQFNSLMNYLPQNTIGVYSFSKYFGVTGWRLGAIALNDNNIIDKRLLKNAPSSVNNRYKMITRKPQDIKFIDRLLIDSRQVTESHTAGLSTPQQVIMTLFAMRDYMDTKRVFNKRLKKLLKRRMSLLLAPIKYQLKESVMNSNYYIILDLIKVSHNLTGDTEFGKYLNKNRDPLEFLMLLAKKYGTVLLPAVGFTGPFWGIRVSIANLVTKKYSLIGQNVKKLMLDYYKQYTKNTTLRKTKRKE
jgi:aspartate 4-decarboxylase